MKASVRCVLKDLKSILIFKNQVVPNRKKKPENARVWITKSDLAAAENKSPGEGGSGIKSPPASTGMGGMGRGSSALEPVVSTPATNRSARARGTKRKAATAVSPVASAPKAKREDDAEEKDWTPHFLDEMPLDEWLLTMKKYVLNPLLSHPRSVAFRKPVDAKALDINQYHQVITRPMDLTSPDSTVTTAASLASGVVHGHATLSAPAASLTTDDLPDIPSSPPSESLSRGPGGQAPTAATAPVASWPALSTVSSTSPPSQSETRPICALKSSKADSNSAAAHAPFQNLMSPEEKKKQQLEAKLANMVQRHKDLLKKDIAAKRSLLERQLALDIQLKIEEIRAKSAPPPSATETSPTVRSPPPVFSPPPQTPATSAAAPSSPGKKPAEKRKRKDSESTTTAVTPSGGKSEASSAKKRKRSGSTSAGGVAGGTKTSKSDKLHCICKTKYDPSKFYVGCDVCNEWVSIKPNS